MNWGVFGGCGSGLPLLHIAKKFNLRAYSFFFLQKPTGISSARFFTSSRESFEVTVSGGSTFARVKLKEIDGMAPQDVERAV